MSSVTGAAKDTARDFSEGRGNSEVTENRRDGGDVVWKSTALAMHIEHSNKMTKSHRTNISYLQNVINLSKLSYSVLDDLKHLLTNRSTCIYFFQQLHGRSVWGEKRQ